MSSRGDRMNALKAALLAAWPLRVVTREYKDFGNRVDADLLAGIYTLVSAGERDFTNVPGYNAKDGTHEILIHGQLRVAEDVDGVGLEDAEFVMVDEIVALCGALPATLCQLDLVSYAQSQQLEHPYGWVSFALEYRP